MTLLEEEYLNKIAALAAEIANFKRKVGNYFTSICNILNA